MKRRFFYYSFLVLSLFGCLDKVDIALRQETQKLVVEGGILSDAANFSVKLSLTRQFGNALEISPVRGALVSISDETNKTITLKSAITEAGTYSASAQLLKIQAGKSYKLHIKLLDGREFASLPETMPQTVAIANLSSVFVDGINKGYNVYAETQDPKNTQNYYRWTASSIYARKSTGVPDNFGSVCCDRCWLKEINEGVNILSDVNIDGGLIKKRQVLFSPFYHYGDQYVEVTQYTMTKGAYQFWQRYQEQLTRTGGIFDPIPSPILGNVVNIKDVDDIALGYFSATAVSKSRLVINGDDLVGKVQIQNEFIKQGDCAKLYPYAVYTLNPPPGW